MIIICGIQAALSLRLTQLCFSTIKTGAIPNTLYLGALNRILGRRQDRHVQADEVLDRVVDPEQQVDDEILEHEVQDALHRRRPLLRTSLSTPVLYEVRLHAEAISTFAKQC